MKYLMLIYTNPKTWAHPSFQHLGEVTTEREREELTREFEAFLKEINESGEMIDAGPLADPSTAKTVRVRGGATEATDGPFLESKEHLAGFFIVDCESPERAVAIAARFPEARYYAVEVRPVMDLAGTEM